jgi:hypothetical protein
MIDAIKRTAYGKWNEILSLPLNRQDHNGQPCPKCGGTDRFNTDREFAENGKVYCRHCLPKGSGDGIGTFAWFQGIENGEAIKQLGSMLGVSSERSDAPLLDLIDLVCKDKSMPRDAFMQFGGKLDVRGKTEVVRIPVFNAKGEPHSYFDLWVGDKGKFRRGEGSAGLFLPSRLPQPGEPWLLVEGVKDASALIGLGYPNVCGLPTNVLGAAYAAMFRGCHIIVVPDNDIPGHLGAKKTGSVLVGIADSVRIARLPGEVLDSKGQDVRDILRQRGADAVRAAIDAAEPWKPAESEPCKDTRPEVLLLLNEGFVADQVVKHLGNLGWFSDWLPERIREQCRVFVRGGELVHVVASEDPDTIGRLTVAAMPSAIVRERITQSCQLQTEGVDSQGNVVVKPTRPPKWLTDAVVSRGHYCGNVRPLTGIIQTPTLRSDGSIIQVAGWDRATGLIYTPNAEYPAIPDKPTMEDALKAWELLQEVIVDFPLVGDADKSAWLSMLLSMVARTCIDGCVPMFAIDANCRGAGKSMLVDCASIIAYGHNASRKTFTNDEAEQRKLITSIAAAGIPSVLFDNVADVTLGGSSIDAALTGTSWIDRWLGTNDIGSWAMNVIWCATGNNLVYGSDLGRRVLPIRLHTPEERPEDRKDFRHTNLLGWVVENRTRLAVAALTILRSHFANGSVKTDSQTWGSFESWTSTIRGAIVGIGLADPLPNRQFANQSDETRNLLSLLITGLIESGNTGLTASQLENVVNAPAMNEAVKQICPVKFNARSIGQKLSGFRGRRWQGYEIDAYEGHGGVKRWYAKKSNGCNGGIGGIDSPTYAWKSENQPDTSVNTHTEVAPGGNEPTEPTVTTTRANLRGFV